MRWATGCAFLFVSACDLFPDVGGLTDASATTDVSDAAVDVAAKDVADAGPSCEATFCDDFDKGQLGATWSFETAQANVQLSLDAPAVSAPNAFHVVYGGDAGKKSGMLRKDFSSASSITCEVDLQFAPNTTSDLLTIQFGGPNNDDNTVWLDMFNGDLGLREDSVLADGGCACPGWNDTVKSAVPTNTWLHVKVAITNFTQLDAYVDGAHVLAQTIIGSGPVASKVQIGIIESGFAADVRFDDFQCTTTP